MTQTQIEKITSNVNVPRAYDLAVSDMEELYRLILQGQEWESLTAAFKYGYMRGQAQQKNAAKRRRQKQ